MAARSAGRLERAGTGADRRPLGRAPVAAGRPVRRGRRRVGRRRGCRRVRARRVRAARARHRGRWVARHRGPQPRPHPEPAVELGRRTAVRAVGRREPAHGGGRAGAAGAPAVVAGVAQQRGHGRWRHPGLRRTGMAVRTAGLHDGVDVRGAGRQQPGRLAVRLRRTRALVRARRVGGRGQRGRRRRSVVRGALARATDATAAVRGSAGPARRRRGHPGHLDGARPAPDQLDAVPGPPGLRAVRHVRRLRVPGRRQERQPEHHADPRVRHRQRVDRARGPRRPAADGRRRPCGRRHDRRHASTAATGGPTWTRPRSSSRPGRWSRHGSC